MNHGDLVVDSAIFKSRAKSVCAKGRLTVFVLLAIATIAQVFIDGSSSNLVAVLVVDVSATTTFASVLRGSILRALPLPSLVVLGFNVAYMSGALIWQSLSGISLVYNLNAANITFPACAVFQLSLLCSLYLLYTMPLRTLCSNINSLIFKPMRLMYPPAPLQLWIMGLLGIVAWLLVKYNNYDGGTQNGDVGSRALLGLSFLSFAPYLIPILERQSAALGRKGYGKVRVLLLIFYSFLILALSIVLNARGVFAAGFANLGMTALLLVLIGQLEITKKTKRNLVVLLIALVVLEPVLSDLAIAMVVVRGERANVSSVELAQRTITAFQDKSTLELYRKAEKMLEGSGDYEENYIDNPFVARFINTKYVDNTLSLEDVRSGGHADELWGITADKLLLLLPTPVLHTLGVNLDKESMGFSMGDALYASQYGAGLGGYRLGSTVGHGLAIMGVAVYLVVIPLFVFVFIALQSLTSNVRGVIIISPVILIQIMVCYYMAVSDSLIEPIAFTLRELPQSIIIYCLIFHVTFLFNALFNGKKR